MCAVNSIRIRDFDGEREVYSAHELEEFLLRRFDVHGVKANSFWISREEMHPCLLLLAREDIASLWYTPAETQAGYTSVGTVAFENRLGSTHFYLDKQREEVMNDTIVRFSEAVTAVKDFLESNQLPPSLRWREL